MDSTHASMLTAFPNRGTWVHSFEYTELFRLAAGREDPLDLIQICVLPALLVQLSEQPTHEHKRLGTTTLDATGHESQPQCARAF